LTSAPPWRGPPLSAVIDWGDLTSGDPATDLASARMLLPAENHAEFRSAGGAIDEATWQRSAAWAIAFSLAILTGTGPSEHLRPVAHRTLAAVVDSIC
jgi:aminoglycoside phosphotransferase (APT) family kinase protein